jgi:hypothetical protein
MHGEAWSASARSGFGAVGLAALGVLLGPAAATANTVGHADVVAFAAWYPSASDP